MKIDAFESQIFCESNGIYRTQNFRDLNLAVFWEIQPAQCSKGRKMLLNGVGPGALEEYSLYLYLGTVLFTQKELVGPG